MPKPPGGIALTPSWGMPWRTSISAGCITEIWCSIVIVYGDAADVVELRDEVACQSVLHAKAGLMQRLLSNEWLLRKEK